MILQTFRDLEQRWRNAATCRGDLGEQETLEACADELAAVREALEQELEKAPLHSHVFGHDNDCVFLSELASLGAKEPT